MLAGWRTYRLAAATRRARPRHVLAHRTRWARTKTSAARSSMIQRYEFDRARPTSLTRAVADAAKCTEWMKRSRFCAGGAGVVVAASRVGGGVGASVCYYGSAINDMLAMVTAASTTPGDVPLRRTDDCPLENVGAGRTRWRVRASSSTGTSAGGLRSLAARRRCTTSRGRVGVGPVSPSPGRAPALKGCKSSWRDQVGVVPGRRRRTYRGAPPRSSTTTSVVVGARTSPTSRLPFMKWAMFGIDLRPVVR